MKKDTFCEASAKLKVTFPGSPRELAGHRETHGFSRGERKSRTLRNRFNGLSNGDTPAVGKPSVKPLKRLPGSGFSIR
jgi:hypothetical protein